MRKLKLVIVAMLMVTSAFGDTQQEINHLLDFVENTDCQYDRNGSVHNGSEARDHINMKYDYYKNHIDTSEDFIKYAATKSKISGKKYKIHCQGDEPVFAEDWLLDELKKYRKNNS